MKQIRQGDVYLFPTKTAIPADAKLVPLDNGRIVLAYGEVTGHAHAIRPFDAEAIARTAIAKAQLWALADGSRVLEVKEPVNLTHEEHTAHRIPPGLYIVPVQVDMTVDRMPRRVAD